MTPTDDDDPDVLAFETWAVPIADPAPNGETPPPTLPRSGNADEQGPVFRPDGAPPPNGSFFRLRRDAA